MRKLSFANVLLRGSKTMGFRRGWRLFKSPEFQKVEKQRVDSWKLGPPVPGNDMLPRSGVYRVFPCPIRGALLGIGWFRGAPLATFCMPNGSVETGGEAVDFSRHDA